jgi:plasmid stabilization system protein ParE
VKRRFSPQSLRHLSEIADYIKFENPGAALRVRAAILKSLEILKQFPRIGRLQTTERVRKVVTQKYPFLIYYIVDDAAQEITALAIRHPARDQDFSDN